MRAGVFGNRVYVKRVVKCRKKIWMSEVKVCGVGCVGGGGGG